MSNLSTKVAKQFYREKLAKAPHLHFSKNHDLQFCLVTIMYMRLLLY